LKLTLETRCHQLLAAFELKIDLQVFFSSILANQKQIVKNLNNFSQP